VILRLMTELTRGRLPRVAVPLGGIESIKCKFARPRFERNCRFSETHHKK